MDTFNLGNYQFHYYISRKPSEKKISICFIPLVDTENILFQTNTAPQKITYEIYNTLEDILGKDMNFKPLFSQEMTFFEIEVMPTYKNVEETSVKLRQTVGLYQ